MRVTQPEPDTAETDTAGYGLSTDSTVLDEVPLERLEAEISSFAARLAAATAVWLLWVGAYDRRRGWESWGAKSCAHWLNWHCGMSPRSAREHVSVAHKLREFEMLREAFVAGELSYSKVRALCRVVEAANEAELVELAQLTTASQLERIVGKMPSPSKESEDVETTSTEMSTRINGDGTATFTITAPIDDIAAATDNVHARVTRTIDDEAAEGETRSAAIERLGGLGRLRADTALGLMSGRIDLTEEPPAEVLIVADVEVLTGADESGESTAGNHRISAETARRLCCDGAIEAAVLDNDGEPIGIGRRSRIVPRWLRRLLLRRDHGMCQFPGCETDRRLHAHHVIHWAHDGATDLDNLVSLCHFHHHSVHGGGWNVCRSEVGWNFTDAAGVHHRVPVLRLPESDNRPRAILPRSKSGTAAPLRGLGESCNTDYVADIVVANTHRRRLALSDRRLP